MHTTFRVLSGLLFVAPISALAQGTWHYDPLDAGAGYVLGGTSFVQDDQGEGYLAFETSDLSMYFCHWTEEGWDTPQYIGGNAFLGGTSIALDSNGMPHVVWIAQIETDPSMSTSFMVNYSTWNGSAWTTEALFPVEADGKYGISLALAQDDSPRIAYYESGLPTEPRAVVFIEKNGSAWSSDTLAWSNILLPYTDAQRCSMELDAEDTPHIAFLQADDSFGDGDLIYATRPSSTWQLTTVDSISNCGHSPSLALTAYGQPRIAYFRKYPSENVAYYASLDGSAWTTSAFYPFGGYTSLALNGEGQPRIAFISSTSDDTHHVQYGVWSGSSWGFTSVDPATEVKTSVVNLALDEFEQSYITYLRDDDIEIGFAWLNLPPQDFDLLAPAHGAYVTSTPTLTWEQADHRVDYDVWYAVDPDFDPHWEFTDIQGTEFQFPAGYLSPGGTYHWKVLARDHHDGYQTWSTAPGGGGGDAYWTMNILSTGTEGQVEAELGAPYLSVSPNPSFGEAAVSFQLPWSGPVVLTVYDISGREVERFEEGALPAGQHSLIMEELPSGAYHCRLEVCGYVAAQRLVVLR